MQFLITKLYQHKALTTHKNKQRVLALSLGALFFSSLPFTLSASELQPYKADYNIMRKGKIHGEAKRELEKASDQTYVLKYSSNIEWMIFSDERTEETTFLYQNDKIYPTSYSMVREGTGPDKSYKIDFNRIEKSITHSDKKFPLKVDWREDWQDLLSYQTQLRLDVKAGKTKVSYPIIGKEGDEKNYEFEVVGTETITLPIGNFETIKVKRIYDNDKRQVYVWFAPSLDHMLVQLFKGKDGVEQFQIQLKHFNNESVNI
ncbi:DUF3108 domain-containing protein [Pseudoalteromonas xiamenensis]|uniref:DUF3108 domain-containing protein n=1 Tax=Pseudoalteromonas xiamenensis TaxID=882626 RepID=UPI0027E46CC7|nr:DUF3108 domain-containing protein [Pseudoalteromonas xiamenensis]WMN60333.1 DUF3108 domain-containing protein [Pseudoalteromonas xiamenensis]